MGLYDATKHALEGLTVSAALDFAKDGVRINEVCPGPMLTDGMKYMLNKNPHYADGYLAAMPSGRFIDTDNVGNVFVFLFSDYSKQMTGASISVDDALTVERRA